MNTLSLWTRRDPFTEFDAIVRQAFGTPTQAGFTPAVEIVKDGSDAVVRVELPGLDVEKDVNVEVERGRLVVRGERRDERSSDEDGRTLREVRYGSFRRSFALPRHVTADSISASYDAGVLAVRVANAYADSEPKRIEVSAAPAVESTESAQTE